MLGLLNGGHITQSLVRATGALALLAGVACASFGTLQRTHAAGVAVVLDPVCVVCPPRPTISIDGLGSRTGTITISGENYTPGDPLHVQLLDADSSNLGLVLGEVDTISSYRLTLPLGNGQYVQVPGGRLSASVTVSADSLLLCEGVSMAMVTVVDTVTGARVSTRSFEAAQWWWNLNHVQYCPSPPPPGATSVPSDTATPIATDTPTDTETPIATDTPTDTETPIPTDTPTDTETPIPTDTPTGN